MGVAATAVALVEILVALVATPAARLAPTGGGALTKCDVFLSLAPPGALC